MNTKFSRESAKKSVVDLAAKCKALNIQRETLLARKRAGESNPTIMWDADTPKAYSVGIQDIQFKRAVRGSCSRAHQLAYAFIRGVPRRAIEPKGDTFPLYSVADVLGEHLSEEGRKICDGPWETSAFRGEVMKELWAWQQADPPRRQYERLVHEWIRLQVQGKSEEAAALSKQMDAVQGQLDEADKLWVEGRKPRWDRQRQAAEARQARRRRRAEAA